MQRHVEFARLAGGAAGGDVGVAGGGHAMGGGVAVAPERGLVEVDEAAGQRADVLRAQRAVEPGEDGAGGVEIAVVDVRAAIEGADAAEVVGGHRVLDGQVVLVEDVGGGQVVGVHGAQVSHHGLPDDCVERAGQQVDLGPRHIAGGVDVAVARPGVDDRVQVRQVARRGALHAGGDRDHDIALRAVVRRAGDGAHAFFDGLRVGEMHLHGHVGAGRKAGGGDLIHADVVFRQRHRRDNCGGNGGTQQDRGEQAHGERCERYEHPGRKRAPQCWLRSHAVSDLVLLVSSQGACTQADRAGAGRFRLRQGSGLSNGVVARQWEAR